MTFKQFFLVSLLLSSFVILYVLGSQINDTPPVSTQTPVPRISIQVGGKTISVDIADTPEKRARGLGGVRKLDQDHGMLFTFEQEDASPPFWMKNMVIPIDIIWINDGKITQINERVEPPAPLTADEDLSLILPENPIDYVLEVRAGYTAQYNITVGDPVHIPEDL